jgi:hypothetical protein
MNHTAQNSLKASAYLLGLSVEELIDVLHNASKVKEIRTASGCPFVLPVRESKEESPSEVRQPVSEGRRTDTDCFTEPNYANADECKRAVTQLMHSLDYWQIEATYWHDKWLTNLKSEADQFKAKKAEVERLQSIHSIDSIGIEQLKDEVERLTECNQHLEQIDSYLQSANLNAEEQRSIELEAEVERLSKPAIIGGYNLSQYIRMANSETLEFDNGDIFADMTLPERIKYIVESHARLKAEVERLTNLKSEADQFKAKKAEVERLNTGIQPEGSNDAVGRAVNVLLEKEKEIARLKAECQARQAENSVLAVECDSLKAEVERLRKAGDELAGWFLDYHPSAIAWNAAKEGKQS